MLLLKSAPEIALALADRIRARRLQRGWTQAEMARRAGVRTATYVLFERTGKIALLRLIKVLDVLGLVEAFEQIGQAADLSTLTLDQVLKPARRRGSRSQS